MLTEQQLQDRKLGIGGSDAAAVCGKNPWQTPYDVWLSKTTDSYRVEENEAMHWGNVLEDVVAAEFSRRNNKTLIVSDRTFVHPEYSFMRANVDRLIADECAALEVKTAGEYSAKKWGDELTDAMPEHYALQCAHYCAVLDLEKVYVAVLIGGNKYREYVYTRDMGLEAALIALEKRFWEHHVLGCVPPVAESVSDVLAMHGTDKPIVVKEEVVGMYEQYKSLKASAAELSKQADEYRTEIIRRAGQCGDLVDVTGNKLCSIRKRTRSAIDTALLKKELPEVAEKYMKESSFLEIR
jgi:putative phage-type endonuclease